MAQSRRTPGREEEGSPTPVRLRHCLLRCPLPFASFLLHSQAEGVQGCPYRSVKMTKGATCSLTPRATYCLALSVYMLGMIPIAVRRTALEAVDKRGRRSLQGSVNMHSSKAITMALTLRRSRPHTVIRSSPRLRPRCKRL